MMIKNINFKKENNKTSIIIKNNFIEKYLTNLLNKNHEVFCIVDKKVSFIIKNFRKNKKIKIIYLKANENIKSFKMFNKISDKILSQNINRDSILIAIGGGTVGDLSGFIASTILRGIDFRLIPTTLLAQVDSSIGGKNGINSKFGKNLVGTFYQPKEVIIDTSVLKSLSNRELRSGYAEIVKHALIKDNKFFIWLEKNHKNLFNLNPKTLEFAILKSILIKLYYVKKDSKEILKNSDSRAMLNFGHTIGHALETFYGYNKINHGEAISIGMIIEAKISNRLGFLSNNELKRIENHFNKTKLKITNIDLKNNKIINIVLKDKKNSNGKINIVLLKKLGKSFYYRKIDIDNFKKILKEI